MQVKSTFLIATLAISLLILILGNSGGAPGGRSGAPGDQTCATSSCHAGDLNSGNAMIELSLSSDVTEIEPGATYTVNIALTNPQNANKNGFQILALDPDNSNYGDWQITDGANTQTLAGSDGRTYVTHTRAGNAQTSWQIDWTAPDSMADSVIFYLAVNDANDNGGRTGDDIYTVNLAVPVTQDVSSLEFLNPASILVYPNPIRNTINIRSNEYQFDRFMIFDMAGKRVQEGAYTNTLQVNEFSNGLYTLRLIGEAGQVVKKLQVQR